MKGYIVMFVNADFKKVVTIELIGSTVDQDVIREAMASVIIYFRQELGLEEVSVGEFTEALRFVLDKLGYDYDVSAQAEPQAKKRCRKPSYRGVSVRPFRFNHHNTKPAPAVFCF